MEETEKNLVVGQLRIVIEGYQRRLQYPITNCAITQFLLRGEIAVASQFPLRLIPAPFTVHNSEIEVAMAAQFDQTKRKLDEAASKIEQEIKGVVQHLNDHVVPKIRTEGTQALRNMAQELRKLADRMDDSQKSAKEQK